MAFWMKIMLAWLSNSFPRFSTMVFVQQQLQLQPPFKLAVFIYFDKSTSCIKKNPYCIWRSNKIWTRIVIYFDKNLRILISLKVNWSCMLTTAEKSSSLTSTLEFLISASYLIPVLRVEVFHESNSRLPKYASLTSICGGGQYKAFSSNRNVLI